MAKFLICFRVEQTLAGSIEVEAESAQAAADAFNRGDYDDARTAAKLDLDDSEDSITEIQGPNAESFIPSE